MARRIIRSLHELAYKEHLIVIPSYHKGDVLPRVKNTFMYLPVLNTSVCAEADATLLFLQDEADVPKYDWVQPGIIFWVPKVALKGIAPVRRYVQKECYKYAISTLLMLDDDLRFSYRRLPDEPRTWYPMCDAFCEALHHKSTQRESFTAYALGAFSGMYRTLREKVAVGNRVAAASIVQRFGSMNVTEEKHDARMLHVFMINIAKCAKHCVWFDPEQVVCEDFRFSFDLAKAGLHTVVLPEYVQDDYTNTRAKGGCNEWRNEDHIAIHDEGVMRLSRDYSEFCEVIYEHNSPYCSKGAYNPRINWRAVAREANRVR